MEDEIEARTIAQLARRFIPFLILCYFVAYLDRVNVGFAKLTMDADLKLSETAFGFGAGVFFLSYFLFEVPSNVILDKVGARIWITRIMFSWGVVSGAMAFIPRIAQATGLSAEHVFYALRFLLGFAEAGFFPGIIFFLTLWFPAAYRGRIVGFSWRRSRSRPPSARQSRPRCLASTAPRACAAGNGCSSSKPSRDSSRVRRLLLLTDRPADARWLPEDPRRWCKDASPPKTRGGSRSRRRAFWPASMTSRSRAVARLFRAVACGYGLSFWLPTIVKGFGLSIAMTGLVTAIPYLVGFAACSGGGGDRIFRGSARFISPARRRSRRSALAVRPSSPTRR